ncbi:MAG: DegT/DnrJ/EryC1/StrS family aminotransferase [bacterium]|nr:DegT/DnrJ/EryC1/StrS family aminotransferase [bacterium]
MYRIGEEELEEIRRVFKSKQLSRYGNPKEGHLQEVVQFEREWAEKIGVRYSLLMAGGGTSALASGLIGLGIGPGDEVIVPGYTFIATASAVLNAGAIPVIVEVDETLTLDPVDFEKKITPNTKAVIPVHMQGLPANMDRIIEIAQNHNIKVVEDSCQAVGGSYKGKRLGSLGDVGVFSFNYYKIISCGEGGCIVTNDRLVYERVLIYHDSGFVFLSPSPKEVNIPIFIGLQLRANEIMGAILRVQLRRLDGILSDLRRIKKIFLEELSSTGVKFVPVNDPEGDCGVVVGFQFESEREAREFAQKEGVDGWLPIDTGKHVYSNWEPILEHRVGHHSRVNPFEFPENKNLRVNYSKDMCPKTLDILSRTVFITVNPDWTDEDIEKRIKACKEALR